VTPEGASRDEQGLGGAPDERDETSPDGERWGCLIVDRASRFIVAHATGRIGEELVAAAVRLAASRTGQRPLSWCSDGWRGYAAVLTQQYRRPVRSGRRGRPPLVVPPTLQLTQTVKHRDAHGRLLGIEVRAALGPLVAAPGTVHVERLHGTLRDRLNALTRKTHAFAKTAVTWDALVSLQTFEHNWLRPHPALSTPSVTTGRHYDRPTPAMALHLTNHVWTWQEFLTTSVHVSS